MKGTPLTIADVANTIRAHDIRVVIEPTPDDQFEVSLSMRDGSFTRAVRPALAEALDIALALHIGIRLPITLYPDRIVHAAPKPAIAEAPHAAFVDAPHAFAGADDAYCGICGQRVSHPIHTLTGTPTPENGPTT